MRKTSFWGTAVVLVSALFASCGFFGGSYVDSFNPSGVVGSVKFDFSGAKAVAELEDSSSRAAVTGDELGNIVKILEDGSFETAITFEGFDMKYMPLVQTVLKSPVSDDVFVVFNDTIRLGDEWDAETQSYKNLTLGALIFVRPDGTALDILKTRDDSEYWWNNYIRLRPDTVVFDGSGNLYFAGYDDGIAGTIYKFDPLSSTLTQMVAAVEETNYSKIQITSDGSWILAQGSRGSSGFLRAIPISNPDNFVNIYYSSYYGYQWWVYDDNSGLIYYLLTGDNPGCYTSSKAGGFTDRTYRGKYIGGNPYDWFVNFFDGKIEAEELLDKINNFCAWDIEFRCAGYKDAEALEYIKNNDDEKEYIKNLLSSNDYYISWGFYNYLYIKGTDKNFQDLGFSYYDDFISYTSYHGSEGDRGFSDFFATEKGVYAHFWSYMANNLCVIQITDENGNLVERTTKISFPDGARLDLQKYDDQIVLRYALTDSGGYETGFHRLYSVDMDTGEIINRCENVANGDRLEITSYSVGADNLYFSAVRGTTIENHVVNLITNQSNPLSAITRKVVAFYAF
ncbi:MAG: hypothetical protein J1F14_01350 [Treponema sp.]|nr:hypothetical protein [Treponema sp.]